MANGLRLSASEKQYQYNFGQKFAFGLDFTSTSWKHEVEKSMGQFTMPSDCKLGKVEPGMPSVDPILVAQFFWVCVCVSSVSLLTDSIKNCVWPLLLN